MNYECHVWASVLLRTVEEQDWGIFAARAENPAASGHWLMTYGQQNGRSGLRSNRNHGTLFAIVTPKVSPFISSTKQICILLIYCMPEMMLFLAPKMR